LKGNYVLLSISLCLSLNLLLISCGGRKGEWEGTIDYEANGTEIVRNPMKPIYDEGVFSLEEDLVIGQKEGEEEYMFNQISIDVDNNENIYVFDTKIVEIRVFNKSGKYLRSIGKKGQGPGEIQMPAPTAFQITAHNEIMVFDVSTRKIIFFSLNGEYLREVSASSLTWVANPLRMTPKGNFVARIVFPPISDTIHELKMFDFKFTFLSTLAKLKETPSKPEIINPMKPSLSFAITQDDKIIWGTTNRYELFILNPQGKIIKKIYKKNKLAKLTVHDRERYRKQYEPILTWLGSQYKINLPKHYPAFNNIFADDEGRLFIQTYERVKNKEYIYYFDVFDNIGRFIAKVPIKVRGSNQLIWKKNNLYAVEVDDDGYPFVKRHKIVWKIPLGKENIN